MATQRDQRVGKPAFWLSVLFSGIVATVTLGLFEQPSGVAVNNGQTRRLAAVVMLLLAGIVAFLCFAEAVILLASSPLTTTRLVIGIMLTALGAVCSFATYKQGRKL